MILPPPHHSCFSPFLCGQASWKQVGNPHHASHLVRPLASPTHPSITAPTESLIPGNSSPSATVINIWGLLADLPQVSFLPCHLLWMASLPVSPMLSPTGRSVVLPAWLSSYLPACSPSASFGATKEERDPVHRVSASLYIPPHHARTHARTLLCPHVDPGRMHFIPFQLLYLQSTSFTRTQTLGTSYLRDLARYTDATYLRWNSLSYPPTLHLLLIFKCPLPSHPSQRSESHSRPSLTLYIQ